MTMDLGDDRMNLERNIMTNKIIKDLQERLYSSEEVNQAHQKLNGELQIKLSKYDGTDELKRIADAIEEILRLVKKDMEPKK